MYISANTNTEMAQEDVILESATDHQGSQDHDHQQVLLEEHFLFQIVEYKELNVFRCVARYGYTDVRNEPFEGLLVENLKAFIKVKFLISRTTMHSTSGEKFDIKVGESDDGLVKDENGNQDRQQDLLDREIEAIDKAWSWGVVHLIAENEVTAAKGAGIIKRILIDYAYNFLKRNSRQSEKVFDIPHKLMLKVSMTYEL
ncbi:K+ uptake permease 7 [Prunus dulcis]|uniref:K+ uptake permease 7 n=1 Tax=Prunus dulcis TaxID=3755 RepID=A0A4Y1S1D8_PRUDU|nr:K+ uptake permease 7 [Prunus dulcis]